MRLQMGKVVLREGQVVAQSHRKGQEPWRQEDLIAWENPYPQPNQNPQCISTRCQGPAPTLLEQGVYKPIPTPWMWIHVLSRWSPQNRKLEGPSGSSPTFNWAWALSHRCLLTRKERIAPQPDEQTGGGEQLIGRCWVVAGVESWAIFHFFPVLYILKFLIYNTFGVRLTDL